LLPLDANASYLLQYGLSHRAVRLAGIFAGALGILLVGCWMTNMNSGRAQVRGPLFIAAMVAPAVCASPCSFTTPSFITPLLFCDSHDAQCLQFHGYMNGLCAGLAAIGAWYFD